MHILVRFGLGPSTPVLTAPRGHVQQSTHYKCDRHILAATYDLITSARGPPAGDEHPATVHGYEMICWDLDKALRGE